MNRTVKTLLFWVVIVLSAMLLWQVVRGGANPNRQAAEISYSDFLTRVAAGHVSSVRIAGNVVTGFDDKGNSFRLIAPSNQTPMMDALQQHGVEIWFRETSDQGWPAWLLNLAPLILLGALWFFMIRQMQMRSKVQPQGFPGVSQPNSPPSIGP